MSSKKSSYLKDGRLGEVIALIQVLAYDKNTSRSEDGLSDELKFKPDSDCSWVALAKNHPELFRVREEEGEVDRVSLVSRYVLPHVSEGGKKIRPALDPAVVNKLIEVAVSLHDRQKTHSERWRIIIPMLVAIVGAVASIVAAVVKVGG
ncbi:hypothetical protein [Pseudomonas sp.]|uniref:hypothetical protein n=1 Tax=Pseudomonas sp. TaxID=306 RepID=UPI0031D0FA73